MKVLSIEGCICEICGVEIIESRVRPYRMGFIQVASPVTHVWDLKRRSSNIRIFLNRSLKRLERVFYYNEYYSPGTTGKCQDPKISTLRRSIGAKAIKKVLKHINLKKNLRLRLPYSLELAREHLIKRVPPNWIVYSIRIKSLVDGIGYDSCLTYRVMTSYKNKRRLFRIRSVKWFK